MKLLSWRAIQFRTKAEMKEFLQRELNLPAEKIDEAVDRAQFLQRIGGLSSILFEVLAVHQHTPEIKAIAAAGYEAIAKAVRNPEEWEEINKEVLEEMQAIEALIKPEGSA